MYFSKIESSREANLKFNNQLKANAARRLGDLQRNDMPSAKKASMNWNMEKQWANGAVKGTINRKQSQRLSRRVNEWNNMGGSKRSRADHEHHRPGSYK